MELQIWADCEKQAKKKLDESEKDLSEKIFESENQFKTCVSLCASHARIPGNKNNVEKNGTKKGTTTGD